MLKTTVTQDEIFRVLIQEASKVCPESTFSVITRFFPKDETYQQVLHRDRGDRSDGISYCQGAGASLLEASAKLLESFLRMVDRETNTQNKFLEECELKHTKVTSVLGQARDAAEQLLVFGDLPSTKETP